jgi:hypothetical protein
MLQLRPPRWRRLPSPLPPRPPPRLLTTDDTDPCQRAIELLFTAQASAYARLLTPPTPPESPPQQTWLGHVGGSHAAQHRLAAPQSIPATLASGTRFLDLLPGSVCALSAPVAMLVDRAGNPGVDAGLRSLRPVRDQPHAQPFALSARALLCRSVSGHYGGLFATVRDQPPVLVVGVSTPQCGTSPHGLSCSRPHFARDLFAHLLLSCCFLWSGVSSLRCGTSPSATRIAPLPGPHVSCPSASTHYWPSLRTTLLALCCDPSSPSTQSAPSPPRSNDTHNCDCNDTRATTLDNPPMLHDAPLLPPIRTLGLFASVRD